jgi:hypothetical protein
MVMGKKVRQSGMVTPKQLVDELRELALTQILKKHVEKLLGRPIVKGENLPPDLMRQAAINGMEEAKEFL